MARGFIPILFLDLVCLHGREPLLRLLVAVLQVLESDLNVLAEFVGQESLEEQLLLHGDLHLLALLNGIKLNCMRVRLLQLILL